MLSRRLIRVKSFKVLFAAICSDSANLEHVRSELIRSCEQTRKLYYFLLNISGALVNVANERIEAGLRKFHPTEQEANPNYKFVKNRFVEILEGDPEFGRYCHKNALLWADHDVFVQKVFASISSSDYYLDYMNSGGDSLKEDCSFFARIFEEEFEDNEMLESILEDISPYWMDDLAYVLNVIIKNISVTGNGKGIVHPSTFIKEDDKEFAFRLTEETLLDFESCSSLIEASLANWDSDRLVSTDRILIAMGITESRIFPSIPVKVTINEYVEIAKYYSTPNSRIFVNGILDKIIQTKLAEGEIVKSGRGLIDE